MVVAESSGRVMQRVRSVGAHLMPYPKRPFIA